MTDFSALLHEALGSERTALLLADGRCSRCVYYDTHPTLVHERCADHQAMMGEIHAVWTTGSNAACEAIWAESDGYGEAGYVPDQGYDWSGIRDSSPRAVEAMYRAIHA